MPPFLVLDIAGLSLCLLFSASLAMVVGAADFRRAVNRAFVLFAVMEFGWATTSLLLRLSLWFQVGSPTLLLSLAAFFFGAASPSLLLFSALYAGGRLRWPVAGGMFVLLTLVALSPLLGAGSLLGQPALRPDGMVLYRFSRAGWAGGILPALCVGGAFVVILASRRRRADSFILVSIALVLCGYALGGLLQVDAPVMSIALTAAVALLGWGIVRRQLLNPLRERAHRQELIAQISRRTAMLLDLDELLAQSAALIRDTFDYFTVAIFLASGPELVLRASTLPVLQSRAEPVRLRIGVDGLCGAAAAAGTPILVGDVRRDPRYVTLATGVVTRSELTVPIKRSGRVIGVLDIQSGALNAFSEEDKDTQQTVADQLAIAIENARLYEETRRRAERLALVNRVSAAAGAVLDLDELLAAIYREVTPVFEADAFFIALYDASTQTLDFRIQVDEGKREPRTREPLGARLTSRVVERRAPLLVNDVAAHAPEGLTPQAWGTGKVPTSWIGVPMLVGERIIGVMSVQTYREHRYDEDDLLLAAIIADQAAVAVENARLYEAVRLELDVRQKTEQVLRESEEKFRNLAEESPNMIFITRGRGVAYANRQCEVTMGWTREEIYAPGFDFQTLTAPGYEDLLEANFRRHMAGEEVPPYEYGLLTRAGRRLDVILTSKLIRYGNQSAILGIVTDITARARTERLLQILNAAALSMEQALSPSEIFPAASRVLAAVGYDSAVFLAEPSRRLLRAHCWTEAPSGAVTVLPPEGAAVAFDASSLAAQVLEGRTPLFCADGNGALGRLFAEAGIPRAPAAAAGSTGGLIASALAVGEELVGLLVVSGSDIGPDDVPIYAVFAHQAAAAWRKTRLMGDLQASLLQLRQAQEQLLSAQKMEAVGRLAGGIAHDFNNLLTVISGYASLMGDALEGNPAALEDLDHIRTTVKRASSLTGRLLSFSRKQILQPALMDMNRVVAASLNLLRPLIGEDVEVVVHQAPRQLTVRGDRYQLEQILMNLAVNARDAMPGGGRLLVETAVAELGSSGQATFPGARAGFVGALPAGLAPGPWVVLRVQDNGVGMSEETRAHIFEPFFTTKEEGKGSGLGLSTVYGIVTQAGGKVAVESALARGTTFTVCLPLVREPADRDAEERPPAAAPRGSGTVLLVEDESDVRELARRVLELAGYTVVTASSAREALLVAEGTAVLDCVVTDVVMPGGMSGVEMGERLSRSRPSLPVLYMSGYTDDARFHSASGSPLPFLSKPFQPTDLLGRVRQGIRRQ